MILKTIVEILKSFDKKEIKSFRKFLNSDYFNTNERVAVLYESIIRFYPAFDSADLIHEYLFAELYGNAKFNDKTLRYLLSEIQKLCELFLLQIRIEKEPDEGNKFLALEYRERKLYDKADGKLNKMILELMEKGDYDFETFKKMYELLGLSQINLMLTDKQKINTEKRSSEYFVYYVISSLAHTCNNITAMKVNFNFDTDQFLEDVFVKSVDLQKLLDYFKLPSNLNSLTYEDEISIVMRMYLCFTATISNISDEIYFAEFKSLLKDYSHLFNHYGQYNIFVMFETCCALKRSAIDDLKYRKEYLEVKKLALSKNLYTPYEGHFMEARNFRSILNVAISLEEYDWAEKFVTEYISKVFPEFRDEVFHFSNSELSFAKGNYEEALNHLTGIDYKFDELKRFVKNLTFKIYYELGYIEQVITTEDSYRHFIEKNKKLSDNAKLPNRNFLIFGKELINLRLKPDEFKIKKLHEKISATNSVSSKAWLVDKVKELIGKTRNL
jgi:hypothetical protein